MESQSTTIIVGMHYCPPLMTGLIGAIFLSHSRPYNECEHAISVPFGDGLNPTPKNGRHSGDGVCNPQIEVEVAILNY